MSADKVAAPRFRFRIVPFLAAVFLSLGLPYLAGELVDYARHYSHALIPSMADKLGWLYAQHGLQLVLALIAILVMKWLVPADYGLHLPREKSYVLSALLWGLFFGVLMTAIDCAPELIARTPPKLEYALTARNVAGWLGFKALYVGPTEEVLYRSLLVTFLSVAMPGKVKVRGYEMNGAGIVMAVVYGLCSASFLSQPLIVALGELVCYVALGVLYAYWLEKSKSVLAPIVGHSVSEVSQYALLLAMVAFWH